MPSRVIRGEINSSESLSRVSLGADLTFRALIVAVDDYGRLDARPDALKAALFPMRPMATSKKIAGWLEELVSDGCVQLFEAGGRPYLQLTGWEKHRGKTERARPSKYPSPPGQPDLIPDSCVYFIRNPDNGLIKIGWTGAIKSRVESIRTLIPNAELMGVVPSETRALEKKLHRTFAGHRAGREFFNPAPEILQYIEESAANPSESQPVPHVSEGVPPSPAQDGTGDPRVGSRESRVGVGVERKKERASGALCLCPETLTPEDYEKLASWADQGGFRGQQVNAAFERVRDWSHTSRKKRTRWWVVVKNAMQDGWALKSANGKPPKSWAQQQEDETLEWLKGVSDGTDRKSLGTGAGAAVPDVPERSNGGDQDDVPF